MKRIKTICQNEHFIDVYKFGKDEYYYLGNWCILPCHKIYEQMGEPWDPNFLWAHELDEAGKNEKGWRLLQRKYPKQLRRIKLNWCDMCQCYEYQYFVKINTLNL